MLNKIAQYIDILKEIFSADTLVVTRDGDDLSVTNSRNGKRIDIFKDGNEIILETEGCHANFFMTETEIQRQYDFCELIDTL